MPFEIGCPNHEMFPITSTQGTVTGFTAIATTYGRLNAEDLTNFDYLPEGETIEIDTRKIVEVVDFNQESHRGEHLSVMYAKRLELKSGATLQGPMVWRTDDTLAAPPLPGRHISPLITALFIAGFGIPCLFFYGQVIGLNDPTMVAQAGKWAAWLAAGVFAASLVHIFNKDRYTLMKQIQSDPVAKVFAPARRLWA